MWESGPKQNLLFSIYLRLADVSAKLLFVISEMTSLCVKYTLDNYIPDITVKWWQDYPDMIHRWREASALRETYNCTIAHG